MLPLVISLKWFLILLWCLHNFEHFLIFQGALDPFSEERYLEIGIYVLVVLLANRFPFFLSAKKTRKHIVTSHYTHTHMCTCVHTYWDFPFQFKLVGFFFYNPYSVCISLLQWKTLIYNSNVYFIILFYNAQSFRIAIPLWKANLLSSFFFIFYLDYGYVIKLFTKVQNLLRYLFFNSSAFLPKFEV